MPAAPKADAGIPGPATLVANSLLQPNASPLQPGSADGSAAESLASSRSASVESFDRPDLSRATTTVTTVAEPKPSKGGPGTVTTETFTHVGTSKVGASFSKKDGSITLRPIAGRGTVPSQIKSKRGFSSRTSKFDRNNSDSAKDTFRGFYVLFWLMLAVSAAKTGVRNWQEDGTVFGITFARLITEDGWTLAFSDGVMVVSTFLCVPFAQLMSQGWLRYWPMGAILQHILQTAFLAVSVAWTVYKDWPWVQSGFMVLHTLTMLMKVHSYCATNGDLSEKALELKKLQPKLDKLVKTLGGADKVESEALSAWKAAEDTTDGEASELETKSNDFASSVNLALRKRASRKASDATTTTEGEAESAAHDRLEALTYHPNTELSALAIRIAELDEALVSSGPAKVRYPSNLTYYNFLDFLAVPTLVYELEYPRTNVIRPLYVAEKTGALFGTFGILILIVEHYIIPVKPQAGDSFLKSALDLALPFMLNYLLIFYLIFECVANVFAELTCFADREFYQDWWNSTSFDEFSRKWNVPVHTFLLRHVYSSTISTYRFSKFKAAFTTFLLSACVHELVMAVSMKKLRLYLFVMQMAQLPLIMIGRLPIFRKYPALGNLFFWLGLGSGFPLLAIAYIRF